MRRFYDSGMLYLLLFLASMLARFLWRRAEHKELRAYQIPEQEIEDTYEFYAPVWEPIVPEDELKRQTPSVLAALMVTGEIRPPQLPNLGADLLEAGFDGKYLRRLAGEIVTKRTIESELVEVAEKAFAELGAADALLRINAQLILARLVAREVLEEQLAPSKAVFKIARLYNWHDAGPADEFLSLNYAYEDVLGRNPQGHNAELDTQTREACAALLQEVC